MQYNNDPERHFKSILRHYVRFTSKGLLEPINDLGQGMTVWDCPVNVNADLCFTDTFVHIG